MNEITDKLFPTIAVVYTGDLKEIARIPVPVGVWKLTMPFAVACLGPNGGQPQVYSAVSGITASSVGVTTITSTDSDILNPQPLGGALLLQPAFNAYGAAIGVISWTVESTEDGAYFTLSTLRGDSNPDVILLTLGYRIDPV